MKTRIALASVAAMLLATLPSAQVRQVWVVDTNGGPRSHFTSMQPAIDAAADGDVLLVRDGEYNGGISSEVALVIDNKSLVIQADPPGEVHIGRVDIRNLGPTQSVVIRGCDGAAQDVSNCAGTVLYEEGDFHEFFVSDSAACILRSCTVIPPFFLVVPNRTGGMLVDSSGLYVYDSRIRGYKYEGIRFRGSVGHVEGSSVTGGPTSYVWKCEAAGISATLGSNVSLRESVIEAAIGTSLHCGTPPLYIDPTSTVHTLQGSARRLTVPSPIRARQTAQFIYDGEPGDLVWLAFSGGLSQVQSFPSIVGYFYGLLPLTKLVSAGVVPASGQLQLAAPVPSFPLGSGRVILGFLQAYSVSSSGEGFLSAPTHVQVFNQAVY